VSLVLDSSLTLAWLFEDEHTPTALALLGHVHENGATVPPLWRLEVANALQMALRRGRISAAFRDASLEDLAALDITIDRDGEHRVWTTVLQLAAQHGLTMYDATYLELAQRAGAPLASLDEPLRKAAHTLGIALRGLSTDLGAQA
jgi:predicted nucleic acid-binding protein